MKSVVLFDSESPGESAASKLLYSLCLSSTLKGSNSETKPPHIYTFHTLQKLTSMGNVSSSFSVNLM